jgi:hypothetical protein
MNVVKREYFTKCDQVDKYKGEISQVDPSKGERSKVDRLKVIGLTTDGL